MRALLDVNVIIALLDPDHVFHDRAHDWWAAHAGSGWASCPIVENGVVRIMSNPGYSARRPFTPGELVSRLQVFSMKTDHEFWPDDISLLDGKIFTVERLHSSRQLTDLYLLALAAKHGGLLATFDRSIPTASVPAAGTETLAVI